MIKNINLFIVGTPFYKGAGEGGGGAPVLFKEARLITSNQQMTFTSE